MCVPQVLWERESMPLLFMEELCFSVPFFSTRPNRYIDQSVIFIPSHVTSLSQSKSFISSHMTYLSQSKSSILRLLLYVRGHRATRITTPLLWVPGFICQPSISSLGSSLLWIWATGGGNRYSEYICESETKAKAKMKLNCKSEELLTQLLWRRGHVIHYVTQ